MESRKVVIKCSPSFRTLPSELREEITVEFGSFWKNGAIARSLTKEEERRFLPMVITNGKPEDNDWEEKVLDFWRELSVKVPYPDGKELEVGFELTQKKVKKTVLTTHGEPETITEDETVRVPINVNDFALYELMKISDIVAVSDEELEEKDRFEFFVEDKGEIKRKKIQKSTVKKEADRNFSILTSPKSGEDAKNKIRYIVDINRGYLIQQDDDTLVNPSTEEEYEYCLHYIKENRPEYFNEIIKDDDLEYKAFIDNALSAKVFTMEGNNVVEKGSKELVGSTYLEAVNFLKDAKNTQAYRGYKAKLEKVKE